MEEILGISVMMAAGEDVNGEGTSCQISVISKSDNRSQPFILNSQEKLKDIRNTKIDENFENILLNGIIRDDENDQTDEELESINEKAKFNSPRKHLSKNRNSTSGPESPSANANNIVKQNSELLHHLSVNNLKEIERKSDHSSDEITKPLSCDSSHLTESSCVGSNSDETFESFENSEGSEDSFDSNIVTNNSEKSVKNEAEHMLLAVREIKTPWAKELEQRLANEIKLEDQNKRESKIMKQKNKVVSREHSNLMKAVKEIGTGWAEEIQNANYLKRRHREKVNYKINLLTRVKSEEKSITKMCVSDAQNSHPTRDMPLVHLKKLPTSLKHGPIVTKVKPNMKKQCAAQLILKKAVRVNCKKPTTGNKIVHSKNTVENKPKVKSNKTERQIKVIDLPQASRSANRVPLPNNSEKALYPGVIEPFLISVNDKSSKTSKINYFLETNFKTVEKVKPCISNMTPIMKQRQSTRQQVQSSGYKDIGVKKHSNFLQIIFLNKQNAAFLGLQALKELKSVFISAKHDPSCKLVFLNGSGRAFCSGIDLTLICFRDNQKIATELSVALRDFLRVLVSFPKPIVAGVNGSAVGLGVTILPMCDLVYASDKATFSTPYTKLSQVPEGGASFSFPHVLGPAIASDMLLGERVLTAQEACQYGLVSQVIWPSQFMETLFPKVEKLATESSQGMEATKQLMKACFKSQVEAHVDKECGLLKEQWMSQACQKAIHSMMQSRHFLHT